MEDFVFGEEGLHTENDDTDTLETVFLSVAVDGQHFGFCVYRQNENTLQTEVLFKPNVLTLERIIALVKPTLVLLPPKIVSNATLLSALTSSQTNNDEAETPPHIPYRLLKSSSLEIRKCKAMILQTLQIRSLMRQGTSAGPTQGRQFQGAGMSISSYHALAAVVDFDSTAQVQAIGSLLSFLSTTVFRIEGDGRMIINDLKPLQSQFYMHVPASTLAALHIFQSEQHPLAAAKGASNTKEGFSLFSLLDNTKSRAGRQRLREWMLQPLRDLETIRLRQDGVALFLRPQMAEIRERVLQALSQIGAVEQILQRMEKCAAKPADFLGLLRSISAAMEIGNVLQKEILYDLQRATAEPNTGQRSELADPLFCRFIHYCESILVKCHLNELSDVYQRILATIDDQETNACNAVVIRAGFDETLDTNKAQYESLHETLNELGRELEEEYPSLQPYMSLTFMPQVGFLVALTRDYEYDRDVELPTDFQFMFSTEDDLLTYKNSTCRHLDSSIGDLDAIITDAEHMIVTQLEDYILDHEIESRETFGALAELDCILSFVHYALGENMARPEIVPKEENCIGIMEGRHPLQELILDTPFVPNDTFIDSNARVNVVTGPNFSGKSCYARQVGILVYMSHLGCYLPCKKAQISLTDHIFAQFSSVETCSVPQSSFQLDLSQMGSILRKAGPHSLVLIDEFGKGTSPASGIALLTAALKKFAASESKVVCTTHFLEIFSMGLLSEEHEGIRTLQMSVQISSDTDGSAVPLFRLDKGVANSSAGLVCAKMAGVEQSIIDRAHDIIVKVQNGESVEPRVEILRERLGWSSYARAALQRFLVTEWKNATDDQIEMMLTMVGRN